MFHNFRHAYTLVTRLVQQVNSTNMFLIAAGVAFYGMLSLFPAIAAFIALFGLFSDPLALLSQLDLLHNILPIQVVSLLQDQIMSLAGTSSDTLGWTGFLSLGVAIWSARSGVASLILGLNAIHGRRNRNSIRHYLTALLLTITLLMVAIVALGSVVVAPVILAFVPLGPFTSLLVDLVRWAAALAVLLTALALLYRYGPNNRGSRMRWITPGTGLAVVLWAIASFAFSKYLQNFGRYNEVYGSIGAAIAMLVWLYISAFLILIGAGLNVQWARMRADRDEEARDAAKAEEAEAPSA